MAAADVLVAGAGPAGWAAAAACAAAGLSVELIAPDPHATWRQTYGAWLDELSLAGVPDQSSHHWDTVHVRTVGPDLATLPRTYCLIDNDRLRRTLTEVAGSAVTTASGRAARLDVCPDHLVVHLADGARRTARAVVDATGHPAVFGPRASSGLAYQTAFGLVAQLSAPPIPTGTMCLMDFDATPFGQPDPPTFLYAMDLGSGRWFVEETSLAAHPPVPLRLLEQRLRRRLEDRRAVPTKIVSTERCAFAMNAPLPPAGPAVAFGAAAAMVHPATGYHVATALRNAPDLAAALCDALDEHRHPLDIARAGHRAVWPAEALRRDALYRVGLDVLLGLDTSATQAFFEGFFALPPDAWRGYVSRTSSPLELQWTMARLMARIPAWLGLRVLRSVASPTTLRRFATALAPTGPRR